MPTTTTAKKALRQNHRRHARNIEGKKVLKNALKTFQKSPSSEALRMTYKRIDKAAKARLITPSRAARLKSRFAKLVK